jgi:hypothetical protein
MIIIITVKNCRAPSASQVAFPFLASSSRNLILCSTHLPVAQVPGTAVPWSESALPSESRESREHADPAGDLDELQRGGSRLRFGDVIGAGMAEAGEVPQPGTRMPRVPAAERQGQDGRVPGRQLISAVFWRPLFCLFYVFGCVECECDV